MSKSNTVIIRDRVYIPLRLVNPSEVKENYTKLMYDDKACMKCPNFQDRHSYLCDTCEAYKGKVKLYNVKEKNGINYIGIPVGDKKNFERKTGLLKEEVKFKDLRRRQPFTVKFKMIIDPRDYQQPVIDDFLKKKYGLIKAPPRTGKTFMMLYIAYKLGHRAVLLANQHEFLTQFLDHIHGNEKEGIPKCTNLPEVEKKLKRKLYGFPKTDEDFKNFQFFVMTYQQFISEKNGKNRFKKIAKNVGTLMIDEVHKANSDEFAKVIAKFPTLYKFGVTGTVERKDKRHFIIKNLIGPVVAQTDREALTPTVILHKTEFSTTRKYTGKRAWVFAMQALAKDKKRNRMIVDWVMKDLANGHNIVIPVTFKKHALDLQAAINKEWQERKNTNKKICAVFTGGGGKKNKEARKDILSEVKANKIRVTVGIRSMLQLGLNVPAWSAIYTAMPISNEPNYRQETKRICTPMENKREPIVRLFVDMDLGQSIGCARNCIRHMQGFGYSFKKNEKQSALMYEVLGNQHRDEGEYGANPDDAMFKPTKSLFDKEQPKRIPVKRL